MIKVLWQNKILLNCWYFWNQICSFVC